VYLLYLDEAGKSGPGDPNQPWYVLGGVIVHDRSWKGLEESLNREIDQHCPPPREDRWEIHMADLHHGKRFFRKMSRDVREKLVDASLRVLEDHGARVICVGIDKRRVADHHPQEEPVEQIAYRFMLERFNIYLSRHGGELGIVVADEQREGERSTRRSHLRYRQQGTEYQLISNVIETPFFTPSHWSPLLQLADVVTYHVARKLRGQPCPVWPRLERLFDGGEDYLGKGLKLYPD
jgi:hypothetical protein